MSTATEILVIASKVKARISEKGMRSDGNLVAALSTKVDQLVDEAIARAKTNNRNTVRPGDL